MGAQASGVSVGINRSLWNCLAGDKDVLRATVSVSIMVGLDSGHLTHGVLHASGEKTVNITRWMLAKAASDKTVGKPPTLRSSDDFLENCAKVSPGTAETVRQVSPGNSRGNPTTEAALETVWRNRYRLGPLRSPNVGIPLPRGGLMYSRANARTNLNDSSVTIQQSRH